jgi:hypothetical protein
MLPFVPNLYETIICYGKKGVGDEREKNFLFALPLQNYHRILIQNKVRALSEWMEEQRKRSEIIDSTYQKNGTKTSCHEQNFHS